MFAMNLFHPLVGLKKSLTSLAISIGLLCASLHVMATTVQFQTVMGDFEVNLFDRATPKTVENFLTYVNAAAYSDTVIHRSVSDFIVQGGGFEYTGSLPLKNVPQNPPVINEPVYSNRRGTIAMAKVGGNPDSATTQWFFNLKDNHANLDKQSAGFTVFGQVMGNGMAIIDAMAKLEKFNKGGAFNELPLRNYTSADNSNNVTIDDENFVMIRAIVVLDQNPDTAANLNPVKNTSLNIDPGSSGGGGSLGILSILAISLLGLARIHLIKNSGRRQKL